MLNIHPFNIHLNILEQFHCHEACAKYEKEHVAKCIITSSSAKGSCVIQKAQCGCFGIFPGGLPACVQAQLLCWGS